MEYKLLNELISDDKSTYGTKSVNLGLMLHENINVPKGLVISSDWSVKVMERCEEGELTFTPSEIENLRHIYDKFDNEELAVRSSALMEDLGDTSFAGLYDTVLHVKSFEQMLEAIKKCLLSSNSEHVMAYVKEQNLEVIKGIALIIQSMVASEISGVMFTANPITGNRNDIVINGAKGYGDAVVDGRVPLSFIDDLHVSDCLTEDQSEELKTLGKKLEILFGVAQDIEWTYSKDILYILQSRDITTLYPIDEALLNTDKLSLYMCYNTVIQGMRAPFTPLGYEFWRSTFSGYTSIYYSGKKKIQYPGFIKMINGRIYYDLTEVIGRKIIGRKLHGSLDSKDPAGGRLLKSIYGQYGKTFRAQGGKFKLSMGIVRWGLSLNKYGKISAKNPTKGLEEATSLGDVYISELKNRIEKTTTREDRLALFEVVNEEMLTLAFKIVMYAAYGLKKIEVHEKWLNKHYEEELSINPVRLALPNNPTTMMGIALAKLACEYNKEQKIPSYDDEALLGFLKAYGHRSELDIDMGWSRWHEKPDYIIDLIQSYMKDNKCNQMVERFKEQQEDAELCIKHIEERVTKDFSAKKAKKITSDLRNYRLLAGVRELPKFTAVRALDLLRQIFLQIGDEMVEEGRLQNREDIAYVYVDEMALNDTTDLLDEVTMRKETYKQQNRYNKIPRFILSNGETYEQPEPDKIGENDLVGMPLSSGQVTGVVRILSSPVGVTLNEEDIIVTHNTDPSWTPLFLKVKGLIMESGGPISHGAIVAREYGLPAIGGVAGATDILKDGDVVVLYGGKGIVSRKDLSL
ncbi:MAG: hypothetical protein JEZ08_11815 [Clostridiales bacterium]|nr:hypothetical protein [Clostridiales bacterium]